MSALFALEAEGCTGRELSLLNEDAVVWLDDPNRYAYVREGWYSRATKPVRRPAWYVGRLVGYSTQGSWRTTEWRGFNQRVFYVKPYDRSEDPNSPHYKTTHPTEAVHPASVAPGVRGRRLESGE
ncbi:DUF6009 family protein [Nocardia nepalensis]|uniref:DUF6009 family protein n=1 Tax=Nocardia nepalensis TaxID=3375448 RepID=UPI003B673421